MSDHIYTGVPGTTCYIGGERGAVTAFQYRGGDKVGAFVQLVERPAMLHLDLSLDVAPDSIAPVLAAREIDRDEFDRLIGVPDFRHDFGWREPEPIRSQARDPQ